MPQNTNLNISPYFDDFDKADNFYRVLFRPGYPIQARELTTMQSLLQNQIESFGTHMFKDGSMVIPGQVGYDLDAKAIILQESFLGADIEQYREQLNGKIIEGLTTGVKAKVLFSIPASESDRGYITIYLKYLTSGGDENDIATFVNNEQLICESEITYGNSLIEIGTPFAQMLPTNATAIGSTASIANGVYFIRGYFVDVEEQTIVLDQYGNNPSYRIGLEIFESIVTPEDDPELNDNATGTSNYSAPGAHRFRIRTSLVKKVIDDDTDKNFLELLRINKSQIESFVERSAYNEIARELARRTFDESGDYTVRDFDVRIREHQNDGINNGVYLPGDVSPGGITSSEAYYSIEVGPGKAYVRGYESETLVPTFVDLIKPRTTVGLQNSIIPFELGNYMLMDNVKGSPIVNGNNITANYQVVELRDVAPNGNLTASGRIIGYARVAAYEFHTGTDVNTSATVFKAYLFDIQPLTLFKMSNNVTLSQGHVIRGRTSRAKAFVEGDVVGNDLFSVYQVYGTFRSGEVIERDGVEIGTLDDLFQFEVTDAKGITGRDPDTNAIIFAGDFVLDQETVILGTNFNVPSTGTGTLTGTQSNFTLDLRPGDILTANGTTELQVNLINTSGGTIANKVTSATTVTYSNGGVAADDYAFLVRRRAQVYDRETADLLIEMPKESINQISDESAIVARSFDDITVTGANDFTISLPADEQFLAYDKDHYQLVSLAPTAGTLIDIENNITFNTTGTPRTSLTVSGLAGVTSCRLIASVSKNQAEKKLKNATEMEVMKVERTANSSDKVKYGLTYGSLYGTRIEDDEISLGSTDVYKIHAVYESTDDNAAVIPNLTMQDATIFQKGTIIEGQTSKAKARVVNFNPVSYVCHFVYENDSFFILGETIRGFDANNNVISGLVNDAEGSVNNGSRNITDSFFLDVNQQGHYYDISKLIRYAGSTPPLRKLMIVFDRFTHEATGDYFASQSYVGIDYKDIPSVKFNGETRELRDVLDFRPAVTPVLSGSGTVGSPYYVNCASLDFKDRGFSSGGVANNATIIDIPKPESDFRCDYDYYVGRIDKLFLTDQQQFKVVKGIAGEKDDIPADIDNAMLLATFYHEAYGYGPQNVHIVRENNRRFTMKDIGYIERRVDNLEYYTSLSLLELETAQLSIKDSDGFDKFKNGFLVDNFTSFDSADTAQQDFACAIDFGEGLLRASHYTTNVPLEFNENASSGVTLHETGTLTLPYEEMQFIVQPYASRVENVNPFNVFAYIGRLDLFPSSDDWVDSRRAPDRVVNLEGDFTATMLRLGADQNTGFAPVQWNAWRTNWTSNSSRSSSQFMRRGNWPFIRRINSTTRTSVSSQTRSGLRTRVVPRVDRQSLGDNVIERTVIPFIRSRNIAFAVQRLKPYTRFYSFIDNVDVNFYTTPKLIEITKNPVDDVRTNDTPFVTGETVIGQQSGCRLLLADPNDGFDDGLSPYDKSELPSSYASTTPLLNINTRIMSETVAGDYYGNPIETEILVGQTSGARAVVKTKRLVANTNGDLQGIMWIPNPAVSTNPRFATGTRVIRLTTSANDSRIPGQVDSAASSNYVASGILETKQQTILAVRNADLVRDTVTQNRVVSSSSTSTRDTGWYDPLAQSFLVESKGGAFLTGCDLYFNTKDERIPVSIQVREMANGYPTTKVLAFSDTTLLPSQINLSENGTVPTRFTFQSPIYVTENREYCLVVLSDSNEYKLWISRMGEDDVTSDRTISEQPYAGVLFKSQNASTWTADQYEDLKFILYKAEFASGTTGTAVFNNAKLALGNSGIAELRNNPIQTLKPQVKIVLSDHAANFTIGAEITQTDTSPVPSAIVREVVQGVQGSSNAYIIVDDVNGTFREGVSSGSSYIYRLVSSRSTANITLTGVTGTFTVDEAITNGSGATGVVTAWNSGSGIVSIKSVTGTFADGDPITQEINQVTTGSGTIASSGVSLGGDDINDYPAAPISYFNEAKEITVLHANHCMHDVANNVRISGVTSEVSPTVVDSAYHTNGITANDGVSGTFSLHVNDASAFHTVVNGQGVSTSNPGYIIIRDPEIGQRHFEIIEYSAISSDGKILTLSSGSRGKDGTAALAHSANSIVECYNLDGIPLTEINRLHTQIGSPTLDSYKLAVDSVSTNGITNGGSMVTATQNIQFEQFLPQIQMNQFPETDVIPRLNVVSGTSIKDGANVDEASFINDGVYLDCIANEDNYLTFPKMVCSQVNEDAKLSGSKSLTMQLLLSSENPSLSPVIDTDRCSLITTSNRINEISQANSDAEKAAGDLNDAVYITKVINLLNPANTLKVQFEAWRHPETEIYVMYRILPVGTSLSFDEIGYTYFNGNGKENKTVQKTESYLLRDLEYTLESSQEFTSAQVKIIMTSKNQAYVPNIKNLRVLALSDL
jgi:hypothetical protein